MAANPNNVTASIPKYWSKRMQRKLYKSTVFKQVSSMEEKATLKKGNTVDRPYRSSLTVNDMGADGSFTRQALTDTGQTLVIDKEKEVSFYVKSLDEIQHNYKLRNEYADEGGERLGEQIDGDFLGEYDSATSNVDSGDIAGTSGQGITLSSTNLLKTLGAINQKFNRLDVPRTNRWGAVSAEFENILWQTVGARESNLGDKVGENGLLGVYAGIKLYSSNACGYSASLVTAVIPVADDTFTINGVTFTFKATPSAAGEIDLGADAAATSVLIAAAINNTNGYAAGAGSSTAYYEVSAADRLLLKNVTATDGVTAVTIKATGVSYLVVSETITDAGDIWTTTSQIQHNLFGQGKPIDLVIQKEAMTEIKERSGYIGKDVVSWTAYGIKTFNEGKTKLVDLRLRSDAY